MSRSSTTEKPPAPTSSKSKAPAEKSEKSSKKKGGEEQDQGWFSTTWQKLKRMAQDTWAEIKKITWPDRETTRNLTILVIAMSVILGIFLGGIDWLLLKLFEAI